MLLACGVSASPPFLQSFVLRGEPMPSKTGTLRGFAYLAAFLLMLPMIASIESSGPESALPDALLLHVSEQKYASLS